MVLDRQRGEVQEAQAELARAVEANAHEFAQTLLIEHGAAQVRGTALATAQVKAHQTVLALIDGRLLRSVRNAALRAELQASRAAVAMHLEHAMSLLVAESDGGTDGGPDAH